MLDKWKSAVDQQIDYILSGEPTTEQSVVLAALYALRDRWENKLSPAAKSAADTPEEPESRIDGLLNDLSAAFQHYGVTKAAHLTIPTSDNEKAVTDDLGNILATERQLFSALWQGANKPKREALREWFKWYAEKYKL